ATGPWPGTCIASSRHLCCLTPRGAGGPAAPPAAAPRAGPGSPTGPARYRTRPARLTGSAMFNGPPSQQTPLPVAHLLLPPHIVRRSSPLQELTTVPLVYGPAAAAGEHYADWSSPPAGVAVGLSGDSRAAPFFHELRDLFQPWWPWPYPLMPGRTRV